MLKADKIFHSNRKTLAVEIRPTGEIWLRVPRRCSDRLVKKFLAERSAWIKQKQAQAKLAAAASAAERANHIYFHGEKYLLREAKNGDTVFDPQTHVCAIGKTPIAAVLKAEAARSLLPRAKELAAQFGYLPKQIKLSSAKTRWGSCSSRGNINLSWRLIQAPPFVQDYVICHELAHLAEMNHSEKFWRRVAAMQPRFREAKAWLRAHQRVLVV